MKVKTYCPEYKDWKTEKQWAKAGYVIIDRSKTVELWSNQFCNVCSWYASPDNVRPMTAEELENKKLKEKEHRKKVYAEQKEKRERLKQMAERASILRGEWHTVWQWLSEHRREVNDGAYAESGKTLNERIGKGCCVFGSDYGYFNIKDTRYIEDDEEYKRLIQESNDRYYGNNS